MLSFNEIDSIIEKNINGMIETSRKLSWSNFGKKIKFYVPSFSYYPSKIFKVHRMAFPSISITGDKCALKCKHCDGRILRTMIPALTPEELMETLIKIKNNGGIGCLISGGCSLEGSVPLRKFLSMIKKAKHELGLKIVVHTGIISYEDAKGLSDAGIDAALIDIIGSNETIKDVYRLNVSIEAYESSLRALKMAEIPLVPHVLIGLHYGKLKGEYKALEIISNYDPKAVVMIAFIPIKGTPMGDLNPPSPNDIIKILTIARFLLPNTPLVLGCARPAGNHRVETDALAVKAGVNAIAFPAKSAIDLANEYKLDISFSPKCCSQVYEDIIF
ncbi:MAG: radical SAM protein [Candidatus Bathyarchaeia archaeon]